MRDNHGANGGQQIIALLFHRVSRINEVGRLLCEAGGITRRGNDEFEQVLQRLRIDQDVFGRHRQRQRVAA